MVRKVKGLPHKAKGSKKGRKYGRNLKKCARYRLEHRHEQSHVRRIRRHIARYHDCTSTTAAALRRYEEVLHI